MKCLEATSLGYLHSQKLNIYLQFKIFTHTAYRTCASSILLVPQAFWTLLKDTWTTSNGNLEDSGALGFVDGLDMDSCQTGKLAKV